MSGFTHNPSGGGSGNATSLQGVAVSAAAPSNGQILTFVAAGPDWEPQPATVPPGAFILAGQAGGQIANGGTGTTDTLVLKATANGAPLNGADVIVNNASSQIARFMNQGMVYFGPIAAGFPMFAAQAPILECNNNGTGAIYSENSGLGASFIGTEAAPSVGATVDMRNSRGSVTNPTALQTGDVIGGLRTGSIGLAFANDVAQMWTKATEIHSATAAGNKWEFYNCANTTITKRLVFTIDQDGSITALAGATIGGALNGATNILYLDGGTSSGTANYPNIITAAFKVVQFTAFAGGPSFTLIRVNGNTGAPSAVLNAQVIGSVFFGGQIDTTAGNFTNTVAIEAQAAQNFAAGAVGTSLRFRTTANGTNTLTTALVIGQDQSVNAVTPTGGIGYGTGAGGTVTQTTSRTTGVTINKVCGAITLVSAAGSTTPQTFTVTNSAVAATDVIVVNQKSGTDKYEIFVTNVAAGSFAITFFTTGGTTTEQPVFNFAILNAVTA